MSSNILFLVIMIGVFYALLILPQRRKQKQRQAMMSAIEPGARVLTQTGIYGRVVATHDDIMTLNIAPDVDIEIDPRAIMRVVDPAPVPEPVEEA